MTRSALALVVALLASACAPHRSTSPSSGSAPSASAASASKASAPAAEKKDSTPVCFQEAPTGSHIMKTVCYTPEQLADMTREAQDWLRQSPQSNPRAGGPASPGSSGGGR